MEKKKLKEMSFLDHLEELRWLLVRSTVAILIMAFATYFISDYLFDTIIFGPTRPSILLPIVCFVIYPINWILAKAFVLTNCLLLFKTPKWKDKSICLFGCVFWQDLYLLFLIFYGKFGNLLALLCMKKKRKMLKYSSLFLLYLFFLGVLFGYFVVIPMSVNFLATFSVSDVVKNQFTLDSYIGMVKTSVIASGLFFELPIIIYFLTKLGLVTPEFLRKY